MPGPMPSLSAFVTGWGSSVGGRAAVVVRGRLVRVWRSPFAREALVLVLAAAFVQVVFPYRHDWPAHLAAGGGGVLVLSAVAPRRVGSWIGPLAYVAMAFLGWATEHLLFGPPDLVDVSFTLAGAVLAFDAASEVLAAPVAARRSAAAWGVALIVVSLGYRYLLSIGPT